MVNLEAVLWIMGSLRSNAVHIKEIIAKDDFSVLLISSKLQIDDIDRYTKFLINCSINPLETTDGSQKEIA